MSIVGAMVPTGFVRPSDGMASGLADGARKQLIRALNRLNGSRDLVVALAEGQVPPLVLHILDGNPTRADQADIERLRDGLDSLAGRRTRQERGTV